MSWSIQQVARMSGATARALRYYDEIGLLRPDRVGTNGSPILRDSAASEVAADSAAARPRPRPRTVGAVVDAERDPIEALRRHHDRLLEERGRLDRLASTVATTIKYLEEGADMPAENLFKGFEFTPEYIEREAQRGGDRPEIAGMKSKTAGWSDEDFQSFNHEGAQLERRMLALLRDGDAHDDAATFAVLEDDLALQRKV
jgi:MerR family transcriptional regulator, thiopeptide resistance regulator